ncbi:DUF2505 domain-containing protein [Nannocystis bainbridge]|uniref:DUF2505 domain-containing protein n=1 Tax=Nannocystis bainbridge TaxID=2995303 RepID=A0ABT5ECJ3_9BACT|nr:DUF2505 domain-containing protein [Nannocystis bainbridge]MDC0723596.1 DUF2505 domain-containing protein [Nannocystis bainbridge]
MSKFTLVHEINCDADTFWRVFLDQEYNKKLYLEGLGFNAYDILEQHETDTTVTRKVKGAPKMNLPGPIAKLVGANFSYVEDGKLDRASKLWTWKVTPSSMADKVRNEGSLRIEPIGDNKVRRIADLVVEAKVFGVGGLIESSLEKQLREGWEASVPFMHKWLAEHGNG